MRPEKFRSFSILRRATRRRTANRYVTFVVFHVRPCLPSAIYLFRDTMFAFARQNIAEEGKEKRWRARVFRGAFRRSPLGSFISSHERRISDFEIYSGYAAKFARRISSLFAGGSAAAENKDTLNTPVRRYYYIVRVTGIKLKIQMLILA